MIKQESELSQFLAHSEKYIPAICAGNLKGTNAAIRSMDKIVKAWQAAGKAEEILVPILTSDAASERFFAAAYLMSTAARVKAELTLRDLVETDTTILRSSAAAALRVHSES